MAPKVKAGAKPTSKAKVAPKAPSPEPPPKVELEKLSVFDAETNLNFVEDEDWAALGVSEQNSDAAKKVLEAILILMGDPDTTWENAANALQKPEALVQEIRALGPLGSNELQMQQASLVLGTADLNSLSKVKGALPPAAPKAAKAKAKAEAKEVKPIPGAAAAIALAQLLESYMATERKGQRISHMWPMMCYNKIHLSMQQAFYAQQHVCLVCCSPLATEAALLYCKLSGCVIFNLQELQVKINLSKSMTVEAVRTALGSILKSSMSQGLRLVLLLGSSPPNLRRLCDASQVPMDAFDFEKLPEVAQSLGITYKAGFHLVLLTEMSKQKAEKNLPQVVPAIDDMAVMVVHNASLPTASQLEEANNAPRQSLRGALQLLAAAPNVKPEEPAETTADDEADINAVDFEYVESFGSDWEERWALGPAVQDENGKEIKTGLINAKLVKYPSNPKDAKNCLQLMGGAANAPCTGIWTSFKPLIRPTEVEFEFTVNGKVDMPNACLVFTEQLFEGALPDCKVGVQFTVRGGMQLCGGGGNLVRISNDGKIQNDKWSKVLMKIDWADKVCVAQVDTRGKGYAPAIQTVPFRDPSCMGFSALFIYNTDPQATCWFSSLRIKQSQADMVLTDTEALAARRDLADRLKQREYQMAVDADMEVGMKMGAIKSTTCHGMNLAMEQAANNSSHAMG